VNEIEKKFIQRANPQKVFDIGPGDGIRLFEYLENQNIDFLGLEKFSRLIENSPYQESIIIGDVTEININEFADKGIDCITILGGTMNGIFGQENQRIAWQKVSEILPIEGKVIFDALLIEGFETNNELGEMNLFPGAPPQFFLSKEELYNIWNECKLTIIANEDFRIQGPYPLRYYLLEKRKL
ncbi:MAG: hypothetical protein ACOCP4_03500, partial [Candidatus Woesearchaeota archaeon]